MSGPYPRKLREPRKSRTISGRDSWYYIEPTGITVVAQATIGTTTQVRLTRHQLVLALKAMDEYKTQKQKGHSK